MTSLRYRSELSSHDRSGGIAASGALHLGLLLLLAFGLTVTKPPSVTDDAVGPTVPEVINIPLPPPLPDDTDGGPPKAEDVTPRQVRSRPDADVLSPVSQTAIVHTPNPLAPPAPSILGNGTASSGANSDGNGLGSGRGGKAVNPGAGVAVKARRVSGYIASRDYPESAIEAKARGTTGAIFDISAAGRVSNCTVTSSSGHADLDAAVCRVARERFVYRPARDSDGNRVADTSKEYFTWVLPR